MVPVLEGTCRAGIVQRCLCQEDMGIELLCTLSSLIRQARLSVTEVLGQTESNTQEGPETARESGSY